MCYTLHVHVLALLIGFNLVSSSSNLSCDVDMFLTNDVAALSNIAIYIIIHCIVCLLRILPYSLYTIILIMDISYTVKIVSKFTSFYRLESIVLSLKISNQSLFLLSFYSFIVSSFYRFAVRNIEFILSFYRLPFFFVTIKKERTQFIHYF